MDTIKSYRIRQRLKFGESYRGWGELAPELHLYRRVDSLVHSGQVTYEEMDLEEFRTGVGTYCPELRDQLEAALGVSIPLTVGEALEDPTDDRVAYPATREELEALPLKELRSLAEEVGLETKKKAEIIEALADSAEDDEPEE